MRRTPLSARPMSLGRFVLTRALLCVAVGADSLAAQVPEALLDRVARLDVRDVLIQEALRTLHRSSGVAIAFSPDLLPPERRVTCQCRTLTVRQALDRLLEGTGLEYRATRRQILIVPPSGSGPAAQQTDSGHAVAGTLEGLVVVLPDRRPLTDALVIVRAATDTRAGSTADRPEPTRTRTDRDGRFTLSLPPGRYDVTVSAFGFDDGGEADVVIREGAGTRITLLMSAAFRLPAINVAPSTFGMLRTRGPSGQVITRLALEARPHPGNDVVRAVGQLPGVATLDYSARPFVRGARADEVLTLLDGLELHQPYHLKYWDGSLSIVDVENVSEVSVITGGFTSEYGDRSAGVLAMRSADPPAGPPRTTIGLDFMSSIVKNEGTFHGGKGAWMFSARRGFLGFVFDVMNLYSDEDLRPSYYDLASRVRYELRPGHRVSLQILHAGDDDHGVEEDSTVYRARYGSSYGWLNWDADFSPTLSARTVASLGRISHDREGTDYEGPGGPTVLRVDDRNTTWDLGLRQDWQLETSAATMLKWGFDLRHGTSDYDYFRARSYWDPNLTDPQGPDLWPRYDTVDIAISRSGFRTGAWLAGRIRVADALTVETGLRYDRQSQTGEQQLSPRINAALRLTTGAMLRAAWGQYHQSQALDELWAADGDTTFYPAERAEHRVLGLERRFESGLFLRLEAYQRLLSNPLPEYRTLSRNMGALWEETLEDRVFVRPERGRAEGLELYVQSPEGGRITWSGSWALSRVDEVISGRWVPRPNDQRHAVNLEVAYRPTQDWSIAAGWSYHSPWPFTEVKYAVGETILGHIYWNRYHDVLNQWRLTPYSRVDFRASRKFRTNRGELLFYVDIFNVLDRENTMDVKQSARWIDGRLVKFTDYYPQLPILPSIGMRWTF